jgi:hypothetical protein
MTNLHTLNRRLDRLDGGYPLNCETHERRPARSPDHSRYDHGKGAEMTIDSLNKRLSRLSDLASPMASLADSLDMVCARQKAREDEWRAAGTTGRIPPEPLEPPPTKAARRLDRETRRKIAEMHAREIFLLSGKFDELRAAYAMSDEDLWRFLSQREQAV